MDYEECYELELYEVKRAFNQVSEILTITNIYGIHYREEST